VPVRRAVVPPLLEVAQLEERLPPAIGEGVRVPRVGDLVEEQRLGEAARLGHAVEAAGIDRFALLGVPRARRSRSSMRLATPSASRTWFCMAATRAGGRSEALRRAGAKTR
jgi:hypothetical protein